MSSYQVFARKYRPRTFGDILGQDHVVQTLRNAVEQDRIAQAYLFVGPRGTGKTSTARILAKALNCPGGPKADFDPDDPLCIEIAEGRAIDVLEIDGASNNGVEQVRELRDTVKYAPAVGRYKIYYIDEVHMLSTQAFNALLKTLEEPPPHVKFIFATTEAHKVLPTILSRCQRFDLRPIPAAIIASHLQHVAREEGITLSPEAAQTIARGADGGMRDAQSMLDQLVAFCGNTIEEHHAVEVFGFTSAQTIGELAALILRQQTGPALSLVHAQHEGGRDLQNLLGEIVTFFRNLLVLSIDPDNVLPDVTPEGRRMLKDNLGIAPEDRLLELIDHLAMVQEKMRWAPNKKLHFEMGVVKAVQGLQQVSLTDVVNFLRDAADGVEPPALPAAPPKAPTAAPANTEPPTPAAVAPAPPATIPEPAAPPDAAPPAPEIAPSGPSFPDGSKTVPVVPGMAEAAPAAPKSPEDLWREALTLLEREGAGIAAMSGQVFTRISFEDDRFVCGAPASKEFEVKFVQDSSPDLTRLLGRLAGRPVSLILEVRKDLPDAPGEDDAPGLFDDMDVGLPPVPMDEDEPADDDGPPLPVDRSEAPSAPADPEAESPEEFYKDPLIEKALDLFMGKIVKETR